MDLPAKVVLHCPKALNAADFGPRLKAFVERAVGDGVKLIAVVGPDCELVHDAIDEILVGDGSAPRFILTSWHTGETIEDVLNFTEELGDDYPGAPEVSHAQAWQYLIEKLQAPAAMRSRRSE